MPGMAGEFNLALIGCEFVFDPHSEAAGRMTKKPSAARPPGAKPLTMRENNSINDSVYGGLGLRRQTVPPAAAHGDEKLGGIEIALGLGAGQAEPCLLE
jgi:hypothetical protein